MEKYEPGRRALAPKIFIKKEGYNSPMESVTLELLYRKLIGMEQKLEQLDHCFHEDLLDFSTRTQKNVQKSRIQIQQGKFVTLQDL